MPSQRRVHRRDDVRLRSAIIRIMVRLSIGPRKTGEVDNSDCGTFYLAMWWLQIGKRWRYSSISTVSGSVIKAGIPNCILLIVSSSSVFAGQSSAYPQVSQWKLRKKLRHSSVRNPRLLTPLYLSFTSVSFRNGVKIFGKESKRFILIQDS
jgi:hypothetical protein